ncbi:hypothetical protein THAOC_29452, partial [Thalassiosira oceanica]
MAWELRAVKRTSTAVTTPHDVFWPRRSLSHLHKPRACRVRPRLRVPTAGRSSAPADARGTAGSFVTSFDCPRSPAASFSKRRTLYGRRPRDAPPAPSQLAELPPASPRLVSDRLGDLNHRSTTGRSVLSYMPALDARLHAYPIPHRPSEVRHTDPNQAERPPSPGIRRSPRPVRRPSADPVLAQPMSFTSSDVAVFLSARRDEASANDTPGSQIAQLVTPKIAVTCLRLMTILVLKKWVCRQSAVLPVPATGPLSWQKEPVMEVPQKRARTCPADDDTADGGVAASTAAQQQIAELRAELAKCKSRLDRVVRDLNGC